MLLVLLHRAKGGGLSTLFGGGVQSSLSGSTVVEKNLDRLTLFVTGIWIVSHHRRRSTDQVRLALNPFVTPAGSAPAAAAAALMEDCRRRALAPERTAPDAKDLRQAGCPSGLSRMAPERSPLAAQGRR